MQIKPQPKALASRLTNANRPRKLRRTMAPKQIRMAQRTQSQRRCLHDPPKQTTLHEASSPRRQPCRRSTRSPIFLKRQHEREGASATAEHCCHRPEQCLPSSTEQYLPATAERSATRYCDAFPGVPALIVQNVGFGEMRNGVIGV